MNRSLFSFLFICIFASSAMAEVCGRVTRGSKEAQLIPLKGSVKSKVKLDEVLECGSMLITHEEAVWVELSDLTQFKIAANSFFEFSKKDGNRYQLYRGEVMVTAPSSIHEFELVTPNSLSLFHGGVMLITYVPKSKETTLANFNRKITFKNKFHLDADQVVNAGEISRLWIGEARIVPSQPELMNPHSVKGAFQGFGLPDAEVKELTEIVERAVESRSKSLVADLESWEDIEREKGHSADRALASVSGKDKKVESSIDAKEADIGLSLLKKHLYGDEADQKMFEESRHPASVRKSEKLKDTEYLQKKAKQSLEVKKVLEEIRTFDPEND